jgi:predicted ATP-grasp superfamily ATP-dependent carboligase
MMSAADRHVLIAGVTTRPFAASAARAGYRVTAVDAFGDCDLQEFAEVILARSAAGQNYHPFVAAQAADPVPAQLAAYTSNFENHPAAVTRLSQGRRLLGNPAATLTRVRNPTELMRVLQRFGLPVPQIRSRAPAASSSRISWLLKPRRSGGGHGIRRWSSGQPVPRGMYLQQRIGGKPGSVSFVANGSSAVLLGLSRQLVGEAAFGVGHYRYCGSLLAGQANPLFPEQAELLQRAAELATLLTREFQLVGLNGLDFVARRGIPYLTEVNPRYSSSMELIERSTGVSMFEAHIRACSGALPVEVSPETTVFGKAVVFARRDLEISNLPEQSGAGWIADVPRRGERISRGRPICTVFAEAPTVEACRRTLGARAAAVYRSLRARVVQAA